MDGPFREIGPPAGVGLGAAASGRGRDERAAGADVAERARPYELPCDVAADRPRASGRAGNRRR